MLIALCPSLMMMFSFHDFLPLPRRLSFTWTPNGSILAAIATRKSPVRRCDTRRCLMVGKALDGGNLRHNADELVIISAPALALCLKCIREFHSAWLVPNIYRRLTAIARINIMVSLRFNSIFFYSLVSLSFTSRVSVEWVRAGGTSNS